MSVKATEVMSWLIELANKVGVNSRELFGDIREIKFRLSSGKLDEADLDLELARVVKRANDIRLDARSIVNLAKDAVADVARIKTNQIEA